MPIRKTASFTLFSLLSTLFSTNFEKIDHKKVKNKITCTYSILLISYQHWSVSQVLLLYPEKPDIAAAAAAPADDVIVEAEP